ncbi:MAG: type II toxin-antitoxin system death-on-curing family toxin [Longimicrobiales bacterium]
MPAKEPVWLDLAMLEAMHADLIRGHGGALGVRDKGLLESDLSRPRQRWSYDPSADLASLAAAYGFGLSRNHGFVDGNKRIALMSIYVFLVLNGRELKSTEASAYDTMIGLADGSVSEEQLADWIREHSARFRP